MSTLTSNFIGAEHADRSGLVNRVVPAADLLPQALALAADMPELPAEMLVRYRALIDARRLADGEQAMRARGRGRA